MLVLFVTAAIFSAVAPGPAADSSAAKVKTTTMTLEQALERALANSPHIKAATAATEAAAGHVRQSKMRPNPEIELETENFAGGGELTGFDGAKSSIIISQSFELGGKRNARMGVAASMMERSSISEDASRSEIIRSVVSAYVEALIAQERVQIIEDLKGTAGKLYAAVQKKVQAGKVSPLEEKRAQIENATAELSLKQALERKRRSYIALAATMGESTRVFEQLSGNVFNYVQPLSAETYLANLNNAPAFRDIAQEMNIRRAEIKLEKSLRTPNLNLSGGYRRLNDLGENAFMASFSISLPIFDRNQGAIAASEANLRRSQYEQQAVEISLRSRILALHSHLVASFETVQKFEMTVLPAAWDVMLDMKKGYDAGKFSYLEMLDAQRTYFELRKEFLGFVGDYHNTSLELLSIVAFPKDANLPDPFEYIKGAEK